MGKPKCKTCNGCMDFVWVDSSRYLNCWFCRTWYAGQLSDLQQVENPYLVPCPECTGDENCTNCKGLGKIDRRIIK